MKTTSSAVPAIPTTRPTLISSRNSCDDRPARGTVGRRELDHPDHQRDSDRVVDAGLALEDRPGVAADLLVAKDRKHDRGVGRRERGAEHPGQRPAEVEQEVRAHGDDDRRRERADDPERSDRDDGPAEPSPADVHAAVEEDQDHRDHPDPLHGLDVGQGDRDGERGQQEERRRGDRIALAELGRDDREHHAACDDEHHEPEIAQLGHAVTLTDSLQLPHCGHKEASNT